MIPLLRWLWAPVWARLKPVLLRTRDAALLVMTAGAVLWFTGASRGAAWADDLLDVEEVHIEVGEEPPWLTVHLNVRQPLTGADACPPPQSHGHTHTPCELGDTGPETHIEPQDDDHVADDETQRGDQ